MALPLRGDDFTRTGIFSPVRGGRIRALGNTRGGLPRTGAVATHGRSGHDPACSTTQHFGVLALTDASGFSHAVTPTNAAKSTARKAISHFL